ENAQSNAGEDNFIWVCEDAAPFSMLGQLNGNPDLGGQWYGPGNVPVGNSFNPSTMPGGNYRYIMTAEAPCVTDIAILTIQYYPQPAAGIDNNLALCETANPVNLFNALNGNPQAGGVWTSPTGSATDQFFDPSSDAPGTYTYQFTQVGCIGENSTITMQVEQTHAAGSDQSLHVCYDSGSISLSALLSAAADANGVWLDASGNTLNNNYPIPQTNTSINLTYFVAGSLCPSDLAVYTIFIDSLTTDPPNQSITLCSLDSPFNLTTLYPGCPNVSFYTPSGTLISPILNPNTYSGNTILVEMPSTNTCPDGVGQISVNIENPFWTTDTAFVSVCQTAETYDLNSALPAVLQSGGSWYTAANVMTGNIINLLGPSTMWFRYALNTAPSCGDSDFYLSITIDAPVNAGPDGNVQFCYTDDPVSLATLMPNTANGSGAWTYNGTAYTSNVIHPGTQPPGNYIYTIPANGSCPSDEAILQVFIEYGINYSAGGDIGACSGSPDVQIGLINSPNLTYSWSPSLNLSSTSIAQPNVSFFSSNTEDQEVMYTVTVTDGICTVTDTVDVITYAPPQVNLGDDREICAGQSISFSLNVPGDYNWQPAAYFNGNNATQTITPISDFTAYLELANAQGCVGYDSALITVHPLPVIDYTPAFVSSCSPYSWHAELGNQSQDADEVAWFIPGIGTYYGNNVHILIQDAGLYDVQVTATSAFGCSTQRYYEDVIQVFSNPMASFKYHPTELTTLEYVAQFTDLSIGALNYLWTFDDYGTSTDPEPSFAFPHDDPASFEVCLRVENEYGCADSTCRTITLDNEYILFAPNAFTPDGDGINDTFLPVLRGFDLTTYELQIYNRWGELIFETHDILEPWVGDVRGGEYFGEDQVYNWLIRVKDKEISDFQLFRGSVILLR
ncbi:MAG: gliding motility-associated C-terminal domain-containing protein, partial [Flavobacteriales bacterium]